MVGILQILLWNVHTAKLKMNDGLYAKMVLRAMNVKSVKTYIYVLICLVSACSYQPATDSYCLLDTELQFTRGTISRMNNADIDLIHAHNCKYLKLCNAPEYEELCK